MAEGSLLSAAVGATELSVVCHHHQALARLGSDLVPVAVAADGLVEATELPGRGWVVGVQWHPEDSAADDAHQQQLFTSFARAAATVAPRRTS